MNLMPVFKSAVFASEHVAKTAVSKGSTSLADDAVRGMLSHSRPIGGLHQATQFGDAVAEITGRNAGDSLRVAALESGARRANGRLGATVAKLNKATRANEALTTENASLKEQLAASDLANAATARSREAYKRAAVRARGERDEVRGVAELTKPSKSVSSTKAAVDPAPSPTTADPTPTTVDPTPVAAAAETPPNYMKRGLIAGGIGLGSVGTGIWLTKRGGDDKKKTEKAETPADGSATADAAAGDAAVDPATGAAVDPATGLPIDPATGQPVDPAAAAATDTTPGTTTATGAPRLNTDTMTLNPETAEVIDKTTGQPVGLKIDPSTGLVLDLNGTPTGEQFDLQTGAINDVSGAATAPGTTDPSVTDPAATGSTSTGTAPQLDAQTAAMYEQLAAQLYTDSAATGAATVSPSIDPATGQPVDPYAVSGGGAVDTAPTPTDVGAATTDTGAGQLPY